MTYPFNFSNLLGSLVQPSLQASLQVHSNLIPGIQGVALGTQAKMVSPLGMPVGHFGQVKYFRKKFKEYSKEEFRELSDEPLVKEMLAGMAKVPMEDVAERIKTHLDNMD